MRLADSQVRPIRNSPQHHLLHNPSTSVGEDGCSFYLRRIYGCGSFYTWFRFMLSAARIIIR